MSSSEFRPALAAAAQTSSRADGTVGVFAPATGGWTELAVDQGRLLPLLDGKRTLPQVAHAHFEAHGYVPFAALRDLLRTLAEASLLANPRAELEREGLPLTPSWARRLLGGRTWLWVRAPSWLSPALAVALAAGFAAAAWFDLPFASPASQLFLAYLGAAWALSLRSLVQGALMGPRRTPKLELATLAGIVHLRPGTAGLVLLERPRRLAVLLGGLAALGLAATFAPAGGLGLGVLTALLLDTCPYLPTPLGRALAALWGRVDFSEHARAFVWRRLLEHTQTSRFIAPRSSLWLTGLLALVWLSGLGVGLRVGVWPLAQTFSRTFDEGAPAERVSAAAALVILGVWTALLLALALTGLGRALRVLRPASSLGGRPGQAALLPDLAEVPLLSRLAPGEVGRIAEASRVSEHQPGWSIVVQGAAGDSLFAVLSGEVSVQVEPSSGPPIEVARLSKGDCFGEVALLSQGVRTATVRPLSPTRVAQIPGALFGSVRAAWSEHELPAISRALAALNKSPYFSRLPAARRAEIAPLLQIRAVAPGELVIAEGSAPDAFYLVAWGAFEVFDSRRGPLAYLCAGDHFGEVALLKEAWRTASIRALTPGTLATLPRELFLSVIGQDLGLSASLEALAAQRAAAG